MSGERKHHGSTAEADWRFLQPQKGSFPRRPHQEQKAGPEEFRRISGAQKLIGRVCVFHPGHLSVLRPINPGGIKETRRRLAAASISDTRLLT